MKTDGKPNRPTCPACDSKNVVVRVDGSMFCRRCGNDTRKTSKPKE